MGSCYPEKPSTRSADAMKSVRALWPRPPRLTGSNRLSQERAGLSRLVRQLLQGQPCTTDGSNCKGGAPYPDSRRDLPKLGDRCGITHYPNCWIKRSRKLQAPCSACRAQARMPPRPIRHPCTTLARTCQRRTIAKTISTVFEHQIITVASLSFTI
mgnify:CR=1 FL=1